LRSPIDGVVATPHVENMVGRHLELGDTFAQVMDSARATVNVAVAEEEINLLTAGERGSVKLEGLPTSTFKGDITVVSPSSTPEGEQRMFYARVSVPNPEGTIRPGMQGRAKLYVGLRPAGYVLFRGIGMWAWTKLWGWFGW
jgi:multidrug efflux pump subunit AcrA (membrane-fusion protein)